MTAPRILIVGPSWVGDMVMAQALFIELKRRHPDAELDVLAPDWTRPLLERMPEVRRPLAMPLGHGELKLGERRRLGGELAREGYDRAIVLPNSFKSALVPFWARIPVRTGWTGEMRVGVLNDRRKLDKARYPLMVQRLLALAGDATEPPPKSWPQPSFAIARETQRAALERYGLSLDAAPVLALCPGAEFGPSKQWPESHYARVAEAYLRRGWQVWIFGSPKDHAVGERLVAGVDDAQRERCVNLAGRTSLAEALDLMAGASAAVSNDSGLMHIAAALGRPLAAVYGSSSPDYTPPLTDNARILSLNLACSPCFQRECPLAHHNCMRQLTPEQVLSGLSELAEA